MWGNDAADALIEQVVEALAVLGFYVVREGNHTALARDNPDTIPNHRHIKGSTLRTLLTRAGISRDEVLQVYAQV
jgi:hypothetical protein